VVISRHRRRRRVVVVVTAAAAAAAAAAVVRVDGYEGWFGLPGRWTRAAACAYVRARTCACVRVRACVLACVYMLWSLPTRSARPSPFITVE
jgi:hypothetical protein